MTRRLRVSSVFISLYFLCDGRVIERRRAGVDGSHPVAAAGRSKFAAVPSRHAGHHFALITCPTVMPPILWPQSVHLPKVPVSWNHRHAGPHAASKEAMQEARQESE